MARAAVCIAITTMERSPMSPSRLGSPQPWDGGRACAWAITTTMVGKIFTSPTTAGIGFTTTEMESLRKSLRKLVLRVPEDPGVQDALSLITIATVISTSWLRTTLTSIKRQLQNPEKGHLVSGKVFR